MLLRERRLALYAPRPTGAAAMRCSSRPCDEDGAGAPGRLVLTGSWSTPTTRVSSGCYFQPQVSLDDRRALRGRGAASLAPPRARHPPAFAVHRTLATGAIDTHTDDDARRGPAALRAAGRTPGTGSAWRSTSSGAQPRTTPTSWARSSSCWRTHRVQADQLTLEITENIDRGRPRHGATRRGGACAGWGFGWPSTTSGPARRPCAVSPPARPRAEDRPSFVRNLTDDEKSAVLVQFGHRQWRQWSRA